MALFDWEPKYSVYIDEFDKHHQKLLEQLRNLHQSMLNGQGKQVIGDILDELKKYTQYHFNAEEEKMDELNYPNKEEHKAKHKELISQLDEIIDGYKSGSHQITSDTYQFLNNWLTKHIMGEDKKYIPFFKDKL
ncbi:MAG: bacteriohemerythrin [Salinivirgaceae bacterium]|jgi:hemerythrin|nr:bacteriohemerythrin [Salinivirgaceae bacterium]